MEIQANGLLLMRGIDVVAQVFNSTAVPPTEGVQLARDFAAASLLKEAVRRLVDYVTAPGIVPEEAARKLRAALASAHLALSRTEPPNTPRAETGEMPKQIDGDEL